jgi:hypothetical protein
VSAVLGFVPWIVSWVLVGNAPFRVAVLAALGVAVLATAAAGVRGNRPPAFDLGNAAVFVVLAVAAPDPTAASTSPRPSPGPPRPARPVRRGRRPRS